MKKITLKILDKIRYIICIYPVLFLGLITLPLTLFFDWKGFYILYIANKESCSLAKAKQLLLSGYKVDDLINSATHSSFKHDDGDYEYRRRFSPSYSHVFNNIYNDD